MTTIQTTTVVRAAALTKKPLSTMPRTPLRVLGAVNSRHTTPPPRDEIPSSSNVFLTNARGKPRRFNTGRKKFSKKMALEEGSDDVVLLDATSSSVDEFILSPPDSEIITEDINELQKRDLTAQAIENTLPSPQTAKVTSVAELIAFTLPTMAIWLCDPILSLLDTAMVGLTSTIVCIKCGFRSAR